ncbi:MAG: hypothetical protein GY738_17150 [Pseudoalteromonas sp.]|nr:hypothetical protein [Pseudoalteromonas sp.]
MAPAFHFPLQGIHLFALFFLVASFAGNFIGFRITLRLLKVTEKLNKRSLLLTFAFLTVKALSGLLIYYAGLVEPAGTVLSIVIFSFVLRKFLVLKLWQLIVIPIGVSLLSSFILAVSLLLYMSLFESVSLS